MAAPLTLAELTEFALRNNARTRQAWFAARAAAAGVGLEQADLLPTVTGNFGVNRVRPVSELLPEVGGAAFRKEVGVERHFRDARAATVMAPTTDVLYDFIGKAVCGLPLFG